MFEPSDLSVICCPICKSDLSINDNYLLCIKCKREYHIKNDIPRLLYLGNDDESYNKMWDYKWVVLDNGIGYNYRQIDPNYHPYPNKVFDECEYDGEAFVFLKDGLALDIGCGVGQYSVCLLERGAKRVYAVDLTRGVDIGKKIIEERYPQYKEKIVFIQANARFLPIKTSSMDFSMALASLHHTGYLEECVGEVVRTVKPKHRFSIWIYARPYLALSDNRDFFQFVKLCHETARYLYIEFLYNITKRLPNDILVFILKIFASDTVVFLRNLPLIGKIIKYFTIPGINDRADKGERLINLYDAYSPSHTDYSDESDVVYWSKKYNFNILDFSKWRLGFLGEKGLPCIHADTGAVKRAPFRLDRD